MMEVQKRDLAIGIFDSGIGGLTVAKEIMKQMPSESLVYFGDTARLPYGNKSKETVIRYSRQIYRFLRSEQVKAIVIACNTASAHALDVLSAESDIPVIGVIKAGAHAAVQSTRNGRVGVMGTEGTVRSGVYEKTIREENPEIEVLQKACPLLVPLVEEGLAHDRITDEIINRYMSELKGKYIDTLILGCTHYPLLSAAISRAMGEQVELVNPAYETAAELKEILREQSLLREKGEEGGQRFYVSDLAERFADFASSILPARIAKTEKINIEEY